MSIDKEKFLKEVYDLLCETKDEERLPPFLIAGGYCRDLVMYKASNGNKSFLPNKDLDVFVSIPVDDELKDDILFLYAEQVCRGLGYDLVRGRIMKYQPGKDYHGRTDGELDGHPRLDNIIELYLEGPHDYLTIQFIGVSNGDFTDPLAYVEKEFDIGACMCYYNGTEIVSSKHALVDILGKKFTIVNETPNSKNRVKRFVDRFYPDPKRSKNGKIVWTFPENKAKWVFDMEAAPGRLVQPWDVGFVDNVEVRENNIPE